MRDGDISRVLGRIAFGQNVCGPLSPRCSACPVAPYCARVGVVRSR